MSIFKNKLTPLPPLPCSDAYDTSALIKSQILYFKQLQEHECKFQIYYKLPHFITSEYFINRVHTNSRLISLFHDRAYDQNTFAFLMSYE